jgi:hypothetical protein
MVSPPTTNSLQEAATPDRQHRARRAVERRMSGGEQNT